MDGLDLKAVPADYELGDFSDPQTPRGPWCAWHGYYGDCPECTGQEERWTFEIVQASPDALVIDEAWTVARAPKRRRVGVEGEWAEEWSGPGPAQTGEQFRAHTEAIRQDGDSENVPRPPDHVPIRVNPGLLAKIRLLLDGPRAD